jgi:zinc transport system permease protein
MLDFLQYGFLQEALLIGIILSLSAALLSPFLVLNHQGMIAHGLSHVSFTGYVVGILLLDQPLFIAIPFSILASMFIQWLISKVSIEGDVAIGIVSSFALALGLIIVKLSPRFNISIESLLVGNIFTLRPGDIWISLVILFVISLFIFKFYKPLFLITYDENYAKFLRIDVIKLRYVLSILTALFIVIGVRSIGVLLITALIIFPASTAIRFSHTFKKTFIYGLLIALISTFLGITLAHPLNVPASAMIVMIYGIIFSISFIKLKRGKKI